MLENVNVTNSTNMEEEKKQEPRNEEKQVVDINLTKKEKLIGVLLVLMRIATVFIGIAFVVTVIKGDVFTSLCNAAWLFVAIHWWRTLHGIRVHVGNFIAILEDLERLNEKDAIQKKLIKNQGELISLYKEKDAIRAEAMKNMAEQVQAAQRNNDKSRPL